MPNLGTSELVLILIIALVLFGGGKLAGVGSALGKGIRNFRKSMSGDDEKRHEVEAPKSEES